VDVAQRIAVGGPATGNGRRLRTDPIYWAAQDREEEIDRLLDVFDGDLREVVLARRKRSEPGVVREKHRIAFAMFECEYQDRDVFGLKSSDPCEELRLDR